MGIRKKIAPAPGLPPVEGEVIDINLSQEPWSRYILADGSEIKIKLVVNEFIRLDNTWDQEGNPVYVTRMAPVQAVTAPDNLKRT